MITEQDRLAAVLKGNYLAKWFPKIWYGQEKSKQEKEAQVQKEELEALLKRAQEYLDAYVAKYGPLPIEEKIEENEDE